VRVAKTIEPDAATSALMNEQYELYRRIYPALRDIRRSKSSAAN
jgi:hypothetical protein